MKIINIRKKVLTLLVPLTLGLGFIGNAVPAGDAQTPTALTGGKVVTADEIKKLSDAKGTFFVDTRSPVNFGKGHVPGAASIAYKEKSEKVPNFDIAADQFDVAKLPADKNAKIVFYSDGPAGWKSYKAAVMSIKAGYKNVMYFRGGYADWVAKGYPEEK